MGFKVKANYTPKRHAWLSTLRDKPGTERAARGHTAYSCMVLGWTAWVLGDRPLREELTPLGEATLKRWDKQIKNNC